MGFRRDGLGARGKHVMNVVLRDFERIKHATVEAGVASLAMAKRLEALGERRRVCQTLQHAVHEARVAEVDKARTL